jgi:hypothetical protein
MVKAGKRAAKFENKVEEREECKILKECWRVKKKNEEKKEGERNTTRGTGMSVKNGKIESKRKKDERRAE